MSDDGAEPTQLVAEAVPLPISRLSLDDSDGRSERHPAASGPYSALNGVMVEEDDEEHSDHRSTTSDAIANDLAPQDEIMTGSRNESAASQDEEGRIQSLEAELDRVVSEKDQLEAQYRGLLAKITTMRSTLGEKLRQDADELDRREQQIASLQAANEDLHEAVETLKTELISSNEEADRLHTQAEQLRLRVDDSAQSQLEEVSTREAQLRDLTEDLERCRLEREDWEKQAMRERVSREALEGRIATLDRDLQQARTNKEQLEKERDSHANAAANLHNVLEEFQTLKDKEIAATVEDMQHRLQTSLKGAIELQTRLNEAESKLAASRSDSARCAALTQEVKEKSLLIGKVRHEAVILNEHLTEALRRLKKDTGADNVDRKLVTNVLLSFITTPRADSKRFEMLSLLASILGWTDDDREQAGLQRTGSTAASSSKAGLIGSGRPSAALASSRRRAFSRPTPSTHPSSESFTFNPEEGLEQSFSNLWVEYLLREAQSGSPTKEVAPPVPPLPSSPLTSPSIGSRIMSPFAELNRPISPTKSSFDTPEIPIFRTQADAESSESQSSRTVASTATASAA